MTGDRDLLGRGMEDAAAKVGTTFSTYHFRRDLKIVGMGA